MKDKMNSLYLFIARLDSQQMRLLILILSLSLFVIGAGAPVGGADGNPGGGGSHLP